MKKKSWGEGRWRGSASINFKLASIRFKPHHRHSSTRLISPSTLPLINGDPLFIVQGQDLSMNMRLLCFEDIMAGLVTHLKSKSKSIICFFKIRKNYTSIANANLALKRIIMLLNKNQATTTNNTTNSLYV